MSASLTPHEIVAELDKFIVGQAQAKRMVAIAMRNRWRRQQLEPALRDEIAPKNIIMIGPTGVGKTEIARRLAKLCAAPFIKVEATKYTEIGYVGRDVEAMIRDLMEIGVNLVKTEEYARQKEAAERQAEERLLDLLLPGGASSAEPRSFATPPHPASSDAIPLPAASSSQTSSSTREKLRTLWKKGLLAEREVEVEVDATHETQIGILSMPGMEEVGAHFQDIFSKLSSGKKKRRKMKINDAFTLLVAEETERLIDHDKVIETARERVEQTGIIFIDELDKIAGSDRGTKNADISREGVQRDLLPIIEGSTVNTKYGLVRTDHILFIAAGAFHLNKPSDLMPELQGRFPLRVELSALNKDDFYRILTEPHNALTKQYAALLGTEGLDIEFTDEALRDIAEFAETTNIEMENIGARRLYTIMENILSDLSFDAPGMTEKSVCIDPAYVRKQLGEIRQDKDLSRYIL